ncbi:MAG: cation-translocating P-type ATPase [Acidobacteriia bacterium]|nr:cation-translocating P-type ATPase [Terriglobia bacterium]
MNWHQSDSLAVLRELGTDPAAGRSEAEATRRLAEHGRNELVGTGIRSPWLILWEQLTGLMVVILIIAAILSAVLGDYKDAIAIGAIVVLNAILGFSQEYRAEKAMAALKKLAVPSVRVRRDGEVREIPAFQLVPGDVVLLEAGNFVAADCRVLESAGLQTHEAALTGESEPIRKITDAIDQPELPLGDRHNMAYMGTFVTAGRGQAVVTETGMRTELGRIATLIQTVKREPTPLQRRLNQLGKGLAIVALLLVAVIFVLGLLRGEELKLLFLTVVSIAVAAVPEGLPAVVTIALTLGAQRMLKRRVLIRKLPAVETLGSVTVICTDKTGTLTQNRMTAAVLQLADERLDLAPEPRSGDKETLTGDQSGFGLLLAGGALCNDALIQTGGDQANPLAPSGDPTEAALAIAAARFGLMKHELERVLPRIAEAPFSSERKRMTTVHRLPSDPDPIAFDIGIGRDGVHAPYIAFTKGGVDKLLDISGTVWVKGKAEPLNQSWRDQLAKGHETLAKNGMRVLGVAFRWLDSAPEVADQALERDLTLVGMIGIIDPPRPEAAAAVAKCKTAGIRPVMITGDHPLTAQYIASQLGITGEGPVLTGQEMDRLSVAELELLAESVPVYARVSPAHKLKIVEGFQRRGHIVAMTGDGVNDAPALKKADIGVAMGITGTDVAKEAADMVLLDDNFATIVDAVEEGRVIYDNVRKFIRYILTTNSGEIWLMLAAPLFQMPLPLLPLQILWINLVTDGLPALALGVEPPEPDTMRRPPYRPNENIFGRGLGRHVIWVGLLMGILSLAPGYWYWRAGDPNWQTLVFTTLTLSQMAHVVAIRSERQSLFQMGLLSNKPLLGAVSLTVVLQLALVYVPFLQVFFKTNPLPLPDLALTIALSAVIFVAVEIEKWFARRKQPEMR